MPRARDLRVAAVLGDKAEFGQRDGPGQVRFGGDPPARVQHAVEVGFGDVEIALPARGLAEAEFREDVTGLVALLGGKAHGALQELSGLGQITGLQRAPAQPRQSIGRLGPQAELLGHVQAVPVQPAGLPVVSGGGLRRAEPLDGLQLPPPVTELTEYRQALLGVGPGGGRVAPDHGHLGAGAQGRRDAPVVAEGPEAGQRPGHHGLGHGRITEVRCDEGVEPFQRGTHSGVVDAAERRDGVRAALPGETRKAAPPGRGRGAIGGRSAAEGQGLIQRAPCLG